MKSLLHLALIGMFLLLFTCPEADGQNDYDEITILHAEVMRIGPQTFFDEADAMFDKVMRPVVLKGNQLRTKNGFVFAKVKRFRNTDKQWLRKNGFTATDDLWVVVPENVLGKAVDFEALRKGSNGVQLNTKVTSIKLSCGIACGGMDCDEKRCGSLSKRRCISCSGCCKGGSAGTVVDGTTFLIPSYTQM